MWELYIHLDAQQQSETGAVAEEYFPTPRSLGGLRVAAIVSIHYPLQQHQLFSHLTANPLCIHLVRRYL